MSEYINKLLANNRNMRKMDINVDSLYENNRFDKLLYMIAIIIYLVGTRSQLVLLQFIRTEIINKRLANNVTCENSI